MTTHQQESQQQPGPTVQGTELQSEILALGLTNPVSQCDVDEDDVAAFEVDMKALGLPLSLDSFREWLAGSMVF